MTAGERTDRDWPALLRAARGVPVPDLDVLSVLPWQAEMLVANRYSAGRIHLAGDAAHVMPPFAAMGANTGISDAHELDWKLAAVLRGEAAPTTLPSSSSARRLDAAATFVASLMPSTYVDKAGRRPRLTTLLP
jgi:putative polyketide hydroxylase